MNWDVCVEQLAAELSAEQLNTWIKPLQVEERPDHLSFCA